MTGDESTVANESQPVPTAGEPAPSAPEAVAPPAEADAGAAHSPSGSEDANQDQNQQGGDEPSLMDRLTAPAEPSDEDAGKALEGVDDPDGLLKLTDLEREALSERNTKRFDRLMGLLHEKEQKISELEGQLSEVQKLKEQLGTTEISEETVGLMRLAQTAETDPALAHKTALEWAASLAQEHPDLGLATPAKAPAGLEPFAGELPEDVQEAIDLGLVDEAVVRLGLSAKDAPAPKPKAAKPKGEADGGEGEQTDEGGKPADEAEEQPEDKAKQVFTEDMATEAIRSSLMTVAGCEPEQVDGLFEELLPIVTEIIEANDKAFPNWVVPPEHKPALVLQAWRIREQKRASKVDAPPSGQPPSQQGTSMKRGATPKPPGDKPLPDFNDEANELFATLTG